MKKVMRLNQEEDVISFVKHSSLPYGTYLGVYNKIPAVITIRKCTASMHTVTEMLFHDLVTGRYLCCFNIPVSSELERNIVINKKLEVEDCYDV